MGYLIGTDEAGYGPNFGPLVVSATVWQVEGNPRKVDLYRRLGPAVTRDGNGHATDGAANGSVWIADSKVIYRPPLGLAALERGVHAALACCMTRPSDWGTLWPALTGREPPSVAIDPCCGDFHCELPLAAAGEEIASTAATFSAALAAAGVRLIAVHSRAVFAREFNELVKQQGGKGAALSYVTIGLLGEVIDRLDARPAWVVCDKHGGRNRYGPLLQQRFPETLIEGRGESRARSIYRWPRHDHPMEVHFCARGERYLPVALASMVSKYLREVAMLAFNRFWRERLPDLRPTAGYPGDSRRFRREIAKAQRRLGLADRLVWRAR